MPNLEALSEYAHVSLFEVIGEATVQAMRLETVLERLGADRVDWMKTDSQGTDRRVFESLGLLQQHHVMVVDLEPGVMDGYVGEDLLEDVMAGFRHLPFWCESLVSKGAVRGSAGSLRRHLGDSCLRALSATERTAAGWAEVRYMNTFEATSMQTPRALLLGWVLATLLGQHAFALELAERGALRYAGDARFSRLLNHTRAGIVLRYRLGFVRRAFRRILSLMRGRK